MARQHVGLSDLFHISECYVWKLKPESYIYVRM